MHKLSEVQFKQYAERKAAQTIKRYGLFSKKDRVAVACSGGKDSTVCLYVLKKLGYDVEAITIDAAIGSYTKTNLDNIRAVCQHNHIKLHEISFRKEFGKSLCYMRSVLNSKGYDYSSCMLCGILKRYLLNKHARKLGFDVLATGHNLDDEAQAFVMNVFRNDFGRALRQGPVSGVVKSKGFVRRVKPLYLISESECERYSKIMNFPVDYGICPCSVDAYRRQYVNMINEFEKKHPHVKYNTVRFHERMKGSVRQEHGEVGICEICEEPSKGKVCKTCEIIQQLGR